MKIKVTFEKIYDSDEFYDGVDEEVLSQITEEYFKEGIEMHLYDYMDLDDFKSELITE